MNQRLERVASGTPCFPLLLTDYCKGTLIVRDTTKTLMKALTKQIATKIITGKESLVHQEAVRQAFRESMSERIVPMIKAAADLQRKQGLPHYLDCYAKHMAAQQQHETFLDGIKAVRSASIKCR